MGLLSVFILLAVSALIAAAEVGFFSLVPAQIETLKNNFTPKNQRIIHLLESPKKLLATIVVVLLGIVSAVKKIQEGYLFSICQCFGYFCPFLFMGIILAYSFGFVLIKYTGLHITGSLIEMDPFNGKNLQLKNLILPTIILGFRP